MLKSSKGLTVCLTALVFMSVSVFFLLKPSPGLADAATQAPAASSPDLLAAPAASKIDIAAAMQDRILGNESAPVTIIEYASLTCPHCAHFSTEVLPKLKKSLLDTGKARLIYRDFPLDQFALKAAMMARCVSPLQYYNMIEVIFSNQDRWVKAKDPLAELEKLGTLAGMDAADFKSCTANHDLETAVLNRMQEAQTKYKVGSTPTFIFNDGAEKLTGAEDPEKFEAIVNKLTKGK